MIILRDEKRIARLNLLAKITSYGGMAILLVGLALAFVGQNFQRVFLFQLGALFVGWISSQVGIYLTQRYVRNPRPDQVLDEAVRKVSKDGRIYHFLLPAPHTLLTPHGIIVLNPKPNTGKISVVGDNWQQKGGAFRRLLGQEPIGNPTREVERMVEALANFIRKNAPEVDEVPIGALIVFTTKGATELDLKESRIPAMHYTKVKGFLRQQKRELLPADVYAALRRAFDEKAVHLTEVLYEGDSA
ncbi:MAG: NERD domain-containing protein [Chloroflexi bacterium]|nr:NERD domain-containing protein [Chloroflexota bacterium]